MAKDQHGELISLRSALIGEEKSVPSGAGVAQLASIRSASSTYRYSRDDTSHGEMLMRQRRDALANYEESQASTWYPAEGQHFMMGFRNGDGSWREELFRCESLEPHCILGRFMTGYGAGDTRVFPRDEVVFFPVSEQTTRIMLESQARKDAERAVRRAQTVTAVVSGND